MEYFGKHKRKFSTALMLLFLLGLGAESNALEVLKGDFFWKQYSFENSSLVIQLPFAVKTSPFKASDEKSRVLNQYLANHEKLFALIQYQELKPEFEFNLDKMLASAIKKFSENKENKVLNQFSVKLKYKDHPAGKIFIKYLSEKNEYTLESLIILIGSRKSWCFVNTFQTGDKKSKEASDKIFNSITLK